MKRWDEERTWEDAPADIRYKVVRTTSFPARTWADGYNAAVAEYRRQLQDLDGRA